MSLTQLPDDVLRYELFPFLGLEDRINANRALKPSYRIGKKMPIHIPTELQVRLTIPYVRSLVQGSFYETDRQKRVRIINLVKHFRKYAVILQHNKKFRATTLAKLISFTQPEEFAGSTWSTSGKEFLIHISLEAISSINTYYPYKYEVSVPV